MLNLIFVTTTDCQMQCRHCLRGEASGQHLPFEIVEKAVAGAKKYGIENIHLTGGEPFLYKHLEKTLALARTEGLPVTFSTNGLLLPAHRELLRTYRQQLSILSISVESPRRDVYEQIRGKGHFSQLLDALHFCRKEGLPFGILCCLNKLNVTHIEDVIRFARKQKAVQTHFTAALPCRRSRENDLVLSEEERQKSLRILQKALHFSRLDFFRLAYTPIRIGEPVLASDNLVMCANQSMRYVTIDVDGQIHFCCFLTQYDIPYEREKRLKFARLQDVSFDEALERFQARMAEFLRERLTDYRQERWKRDLDFCSCFYCHKKLIQ
jgi:MoaA/NifB/PqqE/SkfB family radical SAM enzyme